MAFHGRLGARALAKAIDAPSDSFVITVTMNLRQRETWGVHVRAGAGARGHSQAAGRCSGHHLVHVREGRRRLLATVTAGEGPGRACDSDAACTSVEGASSSCPNSDVDVALAASVHSGDLSNERT